MTVGISRGRNGRTLLRSDSFSPDFAVFLTDDRRPRERESSSVIGKSTSGCSSGRSSWALPSAAKPALSPAIDVSTKPQPTTRSIPPVSTTDSPKNWRHSSATSSTTPSRSRAILREFVEYAEEQGDECVFPLERWVVTFRSLAQLFLQETAAGYGYPRPSLGEILYHEAKQPSPSRLTLLEEMNAKLCGGFPS